MASLVADGFYGFLLIRSNVNDTMRKPVSATHLLLLKVDNDIEHIVIYKFDVKLEIAKNIYHR